MRDFKRLAQFSEDEFYNWFRDDFARTLRILSDEGDTIPEKVVSSAFVETELQRLLEQARQYSEILNRDM